MGSSPCMLTSGSSLRDQLQTPQQQQLAWKSRKKQVSSADRMFGSKCWARHQPILYQGICCSSTAAVFAHTLCVTRLLTSSIAPCWLCAAAPAGKPGAGSKAPAAPPFLLQPSSMDLAIDETQELTVLAYPGAEGTFEDVVMCRWVLCCICATVSNAQQS